jgi:splicing factor 3B subunit 2
LFPFSSPFFFLSIHRYGRPLYGDVFTSAEEGGEGAGGSLEGHDVIGQEAVDRTLWGELGSESEDEDEEEEEEEEEEEGEEGEGGGAGGCRDGGIDGAATPSGFASMVSGTTSVTTAVSGVDTPSDSLVDLRKRQGNQVPFPHRLRERGAAVL